VKKISILFTGLVMVLGTLLPQSSFADGYYGSRREGGGRGGANAIAAILAIEVAALIIIDVNQMSRCEANGYRYCDYVDADRCQYQRVNRSEVYTQCRENHRWGTYECVQTQQDSSYYIKSCDGFEHRY